MKTTLLVLACLFLCRSRSISAEPFKAPPAMPAAAPLHDGLHDFDFAVGAWQEHSVRLDKPLTGSTTWFEMDGYSVARSALGGQINLVEYEGDSSRGHLSLIARRVYDPASHQWQLNFANSRKGELSSPPLVGSFHDGHGEFFAADDLDGRAILVRFTVTPLSATSQRSEQAFSADGGKTWETNWINTYTRISDDQLARLISSKPARKETHDFDFNFNHGTSKIQVSRLLKPLSGSTTRAAYTGTLTVHKFWNGQADLVELVADGVAGHLEGVGLRIYNPNAHQWTIDWVNKGGGGGSGQPAAGEFKHGRGELYNTEVYDGRSILVRSAWFDITPTSAKFEQAFSTDGGKTWESNWLMTVTPAG